MGKNINIIAYKFYTEGTKQKITSLPIDYEVLRELAAQKGWIISTYQAGRHIIKSMNYEDVAKRKDSFTVQCKDGSKIIFCKDGLSLSKRNFTIAHEFGHIILEHTSAGIFGESADPAEELRQENEADSFAYAFLAPPIILCNCNVKTAEEVERITLLDETDSAVVYSRLSGVGTAVTESESAILEQFAGYIDSFLQNRRAYFFKNLLHKPAFYLSCAVLAFVIAAGAFALNYMTATQVSVETPVATETPLSTESVVQTELPSDLRTPTEHPPNALQSGGSVAPPQRIIATQAPTPQSTPHPIAQPVPASEPETVVPPVENDYTVYVTKTGYAYHKAGCRHIKNREYSATTRNAAISNGKSACLDCNPG